MPIQKQIELSISTTVKGALVAGLLLASAVALPLRAQQLPAQPNDVRKQLNQPSPSPVAGVAPAAAKAQPMPKPIAKPAPKLAPKPNTKPVAEAGAKPPMKPAL